MVMQENTEHLADELLYEERDSLMTILRKGPTQKKIKTDILKKQKKIKLKKALSLKHEH